MKRVDLLGGSPQHSAALQVMDLDQPDANWEKYSNWADSIRSFPQVIKKTVSETAPYGRLRPFSVIFMFQRPVKGASSAPFVTFSLSLRRSAAAAVRAGERGSVCRDEEGLPPPSHRAVPV